MFGTKKTIDKILGDISLKINQLKDLAEQHSKNAKNHSQEVLNQQYLAANEAAFRDRATRIAEKFEELLK